MSIRPHNTIHNAPLAVKKLSNTNIKASKSINNNNSNTAKIEELCAEFLASAKSSSPQSAVSKLNDLRCIILFQGLSNEGKYDKTVRGKVWKIMLGLDSISSDNYISLVAKHESNKYSKIRGDSFRTFPKDVEFKNSVSEVEIIRLLNSFVHSFSPNFTYCQGMNTICAPFLYTMNELEAYYCFVKLITVKTPLYWLSSHIGVEAGCKLVDECLAVVDSELYHHLASRSLQAYVYAFHCVSSLCASIPPFTELIKLWDFLLAFGPHLNILCVTAQILALRSQLLASEAPKDILDYRKWPAMKANFTISLAMSILPQLPKQLYDNICEHAHNPNIAAIITGRKVEATLL
jgi:cell cycle arrest protein BUB2